MSIAPFDKAVRINPNAKLKDASTLAPVSGRTVYFFVNDIYLCKGVTDSTGLAKCVATVDQHIDAAASFKVDAHFYGDKTYKVADSAQLICAVGTCAGL